MTSDRSVTVCFPFAGDVLGGSHVSVLGLLRHLDTERYRPLLVVQRPGGEVATFFQDNGFAVEHPFDWTDLPFARRPSLRQLAGTLRDIAPQTRFLKQRRVDIVHTNDGRTHATWAVPARLSGAKLLWHHRGDPTAFGLRFAAPILANRVLTVSEFSLPRPGLFSAAGKASVAHSPFDTSVAEDRQAARQALVDELELPPNALILGYFGLFVDRKRPLLFIDTIDRLKRLLPHRHVVGTMFGVPEDADVAARMDQRIAQLGLTDRIHLMGYRSPGSRWIAACDILLIPAVGEPFGRTLVEAMLVGTPIVATRSGGNTEALRNGELGLLVPPEDADALAEACARLAEDPEQARRFADRAQSDARTRFGEDRHAALVEAAYREIAG